MAVLYFGKQMMVVGIENLLKWLFRSSGNCMQVRPVRPAQRKYLYRIVERQRSRSASVLFVQEKNTQDHFVIKVLLKYKDAHYNLETLEARQRCQIEALNWNRIFAPGVYLGLAGIVSRGIQNIALSEIIRNPIQKNLNPQTEYALVMRELPKKQRLDVLLEREDERALEDHVRLLARYVANMHKNLVGSPVSEDDGVQWGSFEQLQKKLANNLTLLERIATKKVSSKVTRLKNTLQNAFKQTPYQRYFERRLQQGFIKHCHGDLKTPHIWILPHSFNSLRESEIDELWKYICIVDAIDFNPSFSNIDILSDFAMLVIDVEARRSAGLAQIMKNDYLLYTEQNDLISEAVLTYYIVEKAVMWAIVSIVYDGLPDLGLKFIDLADKHMKRYMEVLVNGEKTMRMNQVIK